MVNVTEWEDSVKKRIRYMANSIWDGINNTNVDAFMSNFNGEEECIGWVLLDMLIYYSSEQEASIIDNLIRLLNRDIWLIEKMASKDLSSQEIRKELNDIYKKTCFVPVDESDLSASAFSLTSQFKKSKEMPIKAEYAKLEEIPLKLAMKYRNIVFYDDLIGTGSQFYGFWNKPIFGDKKISLNDLYMNNENVNFFYIALGACQDGIDYLKGKIPRLRIIVSEYFPKSASVICEDNEYWELNPDKKELVCDYVSKKIGELMKHTEFTKNLPVLFQHCRASNTALPLYWSTASDKWRELYKR